MFCGKSPDEGIIRPTLVIRRHATGITNFILNFIILQHEDGKQLSWEQYNDSYNNFHVVYGKYETSKTILDFKN